MLPWDDLSALEQPVVVEVEERVLTDLHGELLDAEKITVEHLVMYMTGPAPVWWSQGPASFSARSNT